MTQSSLAAAADYSDALITARKAKTAVFWILFVILLAQLSIFFIVRYSRAFGDASTTQPVSTPPWAVFVRYVTNLIAFLGIVLTLVLASDLLLIVLIMVIGRLVGVARVTSAYLWCVILAILLFPWQAFLYFPGIGDADFRIPGVLYTWSELLHDAHFSSSPLDVAALKWARFVVFPLAAMLILLVVQLRSRRGLRQALGEANERLPAERLL